MMWTWVAILYIASAVLLFLAGIGVVAPRMSLALLGASAFVLAFALPTIAAHT